MWSEAQQYSNLPKSNMTKTNQEHGRRAPTMILSDFFILRQHNVYDVSKLCKKDDNDNALAQQHIST